MAFRKFGVINFLEHYQHFPCLWNKLHPNYQNGQARQKAEVQLMKSTGTQTLEELKYKIKFIKKKYENVRKAKENQTDIPNEAELVWFDFAHSFLQNNLDLNYKPNVKHDILQEIKIENDDEETLEVPNKKKRRMHSENAPLPDSNEPVKEDTPGPDPNENLSVENRTIYFSKPSEPVVLRGDIVNSSRASTSDDNTAVRIISVDSRKLSLSSLENGVTKLCDVFKDVECTTPKVASNDSSTTLKKPTSRTKVKTPELLEGSESTSQLLRGLGAGGTALDCFKTPEMTTVKKIQVEPVVNEQDQSNAEESGASISIKEDSVSAHTEVLQVNKRAWSSAGEEIQNISISSLTNTELIGNRSVFDKSNQTDFCEKNNTKNIHNNPNEFLVFGQSVGLQMMNLPLNEAVRLQQIVQTLLSQARLKSLSEGS